MISRFLTSLAVAIGVATTIAPALVPLAGQTQPTSPTLAANLPGADVARPFAAARTQKGYVPPKTPWGHPDLQGNFTNKNEANTPLERPDEFAGKRMEDITPEELAAAVAARQQSAVENAPFITGSRAEGIAIGVPIHWLDHLDANNSRPWFVIAPPDGKIPPQTPEAGQRASARPAARRGRGPADSYTDRSLWDRCIVRSTPMAEMMPKIYGNSFQILQTKEHVIIRYEMVHETRIVPIDNRPFNGIRSYFGDSRALFDGNTLVVVTEGRTFKDAVDFRGSSEKLRAIERFTRTGPKTVEWTVTVEDPATWTEPWTYSVPLTEDDAEPIHEYSCHEGNYAMANILSAQRSDEKKGISTAPPGSRESERAPEGAQR
jgi:hypothetical protein